MKQYTFEDFKAGKIRVITTPGTYAAFADVCDANGLVWVPGYTMSAGALYLRDWGTYGWWTHGQEVRFDPAGPEIRVLFEDLLPCLPVDFLAGKCGLKVDEKDWPEFVRMCSAVGITRWGGGKPIEEDVRGKDAYPVTCGAFMPLRLTYSSSLRPDYPVLRFVPTGQTPPAPADFFSGRIGVRCETREEYDALMRECEGKGIKWISGEPLSGKLPKTIEAGEPETFRIMGDGLVCNIIDFDNAVPFRAIFPDPWAEFAAGRCYLRVKKAEWVEFAKRCIKAGMCWERCGLIQPVGYRGGLGGDGDYFTHGGGKFLDGYDINTRDDKPVIDFSTLLPATPAPYDGRGKHKVGDLFEVTSGDNFNIGDIIRLCDDDGSICPKFERLSDGERHYKIWRNLKPYIPTPSLKIVITTDRRVTTATLYEDGKAVLTGTATCAPDDVFNFDTGATLAYNRLRFGPQFNGPSFADFYALSRKIKALGTEIEGKVGSL